MSTWADTALCTQADLENEIGDVTLFTQRSESESDDIVSRSIATAKKLIANKLKAYLPELFARTCTSISYDNWLIQSGYSYSDLENILDKISNPECLNSAAVALSINCLSKRGLTEFEGTHNERENLLADQRDTWYKEFECRWKEARVLLELDLSGDNVIQDFERQRTHTNFWRV